MPLGAPDWSQALVQQLDGAYAPPDGGYFQPAQVARSHAEV